MSGVPVSKIVHVSSRVHRRTFGGHADVPQRAGGRGGRRWGGEVVSLRSTGPVLHDLLVFGSFVLEPYFHLEDKERVNNRLEADADNMFDVSVCTSLGLFPNNGKNYSK